jgi:hypothetical protein
MTLGLLQSYDQGVKNITVGSASTATYCVQSVVGNYTYRKNGPGADIEALAC